MAMAKKRGLMHKSIVVRRLTGFSSGPNNIAQAALRQLLRNVLRAGMQDMSTLCPRV